MDRNLLYQIKRLYDKLGKLHYKSKEYEELVKQIHKLSEKLDKDELPKQG
jgi:hypothetical protein